MKSTMPYGQLPVVEVTEANGSTTTFAQSNAIMKWIARTYDLSGLSINNFSIVTDASQLSFFFSRYFYQFLVRKIE